MSLYTVCRETDPLDYSVVEETSVPLLALTPEQTAIIRSTGNISINAVAGSGKTTTIIEYARTRPPGSRPRGPSVLFAHPPSRGSLLSKPFGRREFS